MIDVIIWTATYSFATAISIVLLGQRDLISGNLFEPKNLIALLINWKFIVSMIFALVARASFVLTNNALLKIPHLATSSTTITTFITLFCLILVVIANAIFLKERINLTQGIGASLILFGIFLISR